MMRYLMLVDTPHVTEIPIAEVERLNTAAATFHVLVPARSLTEGEREFIRTEENAAEAETRPEVIGAQWRLRTILESLELARLEATGIVAVEDPIDAIEAALEAGGHDAVVVVTEPAGIAGWVKLDLPSRIERHVDEPVVTIEVDSAD